MNNKIVGFDIESNSLEPFLPTSKIICASIADDENVSFYLHHHPEKEKYPYEKNIKALHDIVTTIGDKDVTLVGHNIGFDATFWDAEYIKQLEPKKKYTRQCCAKLFDTMIAYSLFNEGDFNNSLEYLAYDYLNLRKMSYVADRNNLLLAKLSDVIKYNSMDSILSYKLYEPLMNELEDNGVTLLFNWIMRVLNVIINIQIRGVNIDLSFLRKKRGEIENKIEELEKRLQGVYGDINFNSPKQLVEVIYQDWGLPVVKTTRDKFKRDTGNPSTGMDAVVLLKIDKRVSNDKKEALQGLLNYRKLTKIRNTYYKAYAEKHLGFDNRIHSSYYLGRGSIEWKKTLVGTRSGRTASSNPNLQNTPNDEDIDGFRPQVRQCFIPTKGRKIFKADHKQIELRVCGYLSKDKVFQQAFKDDLDIHTLSLSYILEEDYDFILKKLEEGDSKWKERRLFIKRFNFALIYGAGWYQLQQILLQEMEILYPKNMILDNKRRWERTYSGYMDWKESVHALIERDGFVVSDLGRQRQLFEPESFNIHSSNAWKEIAEYRRQGLNTIIQNVASDITVIGAVLLQEELDNYDSHILLPVHDSLDGEHNTKKIKGKKLVSLINHCLIDKTKEVLQDEFELDVSELYLGVDVETDLERWK